MLDTALQPVPTTVHGQEVLLFVWALEGCDDAESGATRGNHGVMADCALTLVDDSPKAVMVLWKEELC